MLPHTGERSQRHTILYVSFGNSFRLASALPPQGLSGAPFLKQIYKWIEDDVAAIRDYAERKDNDFQPEKGNAVTWGIIAETFERGLDPTDEKQRKMATAYLLTWVRDKEVFVKVGNLNNF